MLQLLKDAQLHKRPRVVGLAFLWLFGLASVFLFPAPHRISDQSLTRYEGILKEVSTAALLWCRLPSSATVLLR